MKNRMLVLAFGLAVAVSLAVATLADEATSNATQSPQVSISLDDNEKIPKELWDKLSSDQVYKLLATRAELKNQEIPNLAPVIVAIVFGCPVAIVGLILIFRQRKNAMLHRTLAAMIDKGVPIPPELLQPEQPERRPRSDLRNGLTLIGVGAGLIIFFAFQSRNAVGIGFIPLMIGVGHLITWKLEQKKQNGQNQT